MLQLRGVRREFRANQSITHALRHIDLDVRRGDFLAIEGPSGGGKSTLLNVIGLLDTPSEGNYRIFGSSADALTPRQRARLRSQHFAFIFQGFHLLDHRPVVDSVELNLLYRAVPPQQRRVLALKALETVGLGHRAHHLARNLSGGERQRAAIARALASQAKIVIADEPTGNLDSANSQNIVDSLAALRDAGATIVMVTHSAEVASAASTRALIRDGRIIEHDTSTADDKTPATPSEAASEPVGTPSRVRFRDLLSDALASVRSRRSRMIGLALAVGTGVALAVGTLGVSASATAQVSDAFDAHANRDVTVTWTPDQLAGQTPEQQSSIQERLHGLNGVAAVTLMDEYGQTSVQATPARPTFSTDGYGVTGDPTEAARLTVTWAKAQHTLGIGEILLGANLAKQLQLGPLESTPVILVGDSPYTVVGLVTKSPRIPQLLGGVIQPRTEAIPANRTQALIRTDTGAASLIARQAPHVIDPYQPKELDVSAPTDPSTLREHIQGELQTILTVLTVLVILGSVVGLTNAMMMTVMERKHEFGLRAAIGATPAHISALVVTESTIIGLIGGIAGLVLGLTGVLAVTLLQRWTPVFDLALAPAALIAGIGVGIASGILAAIRAAKIQPHEALRS